MKGLRPSFIGCRKGIAVLEALIVAPVLCAFVGGLIGALFLIGTVFVLNDRLDESLLCLSYRSTSFCQMEAEDFLKSTGLSQWPVHFSSRKSGSRWMAQFQITSKDKSLLTLQRELKVPLTENFR